MQFVPRRSEERGHADHNWLKTFHTFSFAMYQDRNHNQFGPLRVINEDRVAPRTGFGAHSHSEFEIFSYVVSGELEHKDSMGNVEVLKRGDIQLTSAGTGISHSEKTYGSSPVHFLQIWSFPTASRLTPKYYTRHFSDEQKKDKFVKVVAPTDQSPSSSSEEDKVVDDREGSGPTPVHSNLTMYAGILSPGLGKDGNFGISMKGRKGYIHVIQTSGYNTGKAQGAGIKIHSSTPGAFGTEEVTLREGDGAYINIGPGGGELKVENVSGDVVEVVLFDME
ncbi:hypothetical protein AX16_003029 [Volvariella volvacea WC 439]|nr:hypothetical protein AX16_003029 [Volvariella volvacea WC 439]